MTGEEAKDNITGALGEFEVKLKMEGECQISAREVPYIDDTYFKRKSLYKYTKIFVDGKRLEQVS